MSDTMSESAETEKETVKKAKKREEELIIRIAKPDDLETVMEGAVQAFAEIGMAPPDPARVLGEILPALNQDRGFVGLICGPDGKPEGGVLLRIGKMWYSDEDVLEERVVFIFPEYRHLRPSRAKKLVEFSKKTAEDLGLPLLIGIMSTVRTEAKVRMYERQFGKPAGAVFLYNMPPKEVERD